MRQFAALFLVVFGVLALTEALIRQRPQAAFVYGALALTIGPLGLLKPSLVRPIYVAWCVVAFPIGWLVSTTILVLLFYGMFTPIALVFRMMGRDALALRRTKADTYWTPKPAARDPREYFRQS